MKGRGGFLSLAALLLFLSCVTGIPQEEVAQVYFNLGNSYQDQGREKEAGRAYSKAWELDPHLFQAGYNLARLELQEGRISEGRTLLLQLLAEDRENTLLLEALAWSYSLEGDAPEAKRIYQNILTLRPRHFRSLYNLAVLFKTSEEWGASRDAYWELYALDAKEGLPLTREELLLEVALLEIQLQEHSAAVEHLEFLSQSSPSLLGMERLGWLYQEQKLFAKALEAYEKGLARDIPEEESAEDAALRARLMFEKAFILLGIVEDEEPGMEALAEALDAGMVDSDQYKRLLDSEGFLFTERVEELMAAKGIDFGDDEEGEEESPQDSPLHRNRTDYPKIA